MKKITYKVFLFLLTMAIVLCTFPSAVFATETSDVLPILDQDETLREKAMETLFDSSDNVFNKIHFYTGAEEYHVIDNMGELQQAAYDSVETRTNASKALSQINEDSLIKENELQLTIQFESGFFETEEYKAFYEERESIRNTDEVRDFRARLNSFCKEYHRNLVSANIDKLDISENAKVQYVDYSPFVIISADLDTINSDYLLSLASSESIKNVSVSDEIAVSDESVSTFNQMLSHINAQDIVSNGTYTGDGIRIGVFEGGGVCDINNPNLSDKNITIRSGDTDITNHATAVTSVIALMAPDAEFYVCQKKSSDVGVQWFINQGCDVVNCSFGHYNNRDDDDDGIYTHYDISYRYDYDAIYDYQILSSFITVVKSAGNYNNDNTEDDYNPNREISNPGYAYNVITVGGVERSYINSQPQLVLSSISCYNAGIPSVKPNICAVASLNIPNAGTNIGTSYSAPQVTACIALLLESDSGYKLYPERIMALITATADRSYDYVGDVDYFDYELGAGVINLDRMLENDSYWNDYIINETAQTEIYRTSVSIPAGNQLQAGLSWLVDADRTVSGGQYVYDIFEMDYDLKLYNSAGRLVCSSELALTNVEMLRYYTSKGGIFTLVVYQYDQQAEYGGNYMSLVYNVEPHS